MFSDNDYNMFPQGDKGKDGGAGGDGGLGPIGPAGNKVIMTLSHSGHCMNRLL